jgi:hypothetical protein
MMETESKNTPTAVSIPDFNSEKTPLSEDELLAVWKQDEYWGQAGSFSVDVLTGKRTPI